MQEGGKGGIGGGGDEVGREGGGLRSGLQESRGLNSQHIEEMFWKHLISLLKI